MPNNNNNTDIPLLSTTSFLHYIPTSSSDSTNELDFHLPSRTSLHGLTVAEWAGSKSKHSCKQNVYILTTTNTISIIYTSSHNTHTDDNWKDVYRNIKCMDQLYDASFYSWLKSEENVLVTAMYLHRIANEYPLVRIINALKWLISDWRLESISDLRRAHLLRHLTNSWATQYTTTLITMVLSSAPYASATHLQRERFLRAFTKDWDFSKLSEFFMYLQSPANIDYKVKCVMLQEAARRERETLGAKLYHRKKQTEEEEEKPGEGETEIDDGNRRHHRRTSSNDVNDIKRLRLSTPDLDHVEGLQEANVGSSSTNNPHLHLRSVTSSPPPSITSSNSTNTNNTNVGNNNSSSSGGGSGGGSSSNSSGSHSSSNDSSGITSGNINNNNTHDFIYPSSLPGLSHLRRRSSSIGSTDSCDMIEDAVDATTTATATTETALKKKNVPSSSNNHVSSFFTE
ncbi:hypothetical protein BCV72DRAFT_248268 [Rhizopus microsporus var. microsporus]|uniref:Uncharacterized protein n=1 Tax=Rhizopus microsporus var. microsporus TaxID=86635 RepID=A0A1X0RBF7_RHIZD|nr:hypothetical protein BCV72DRAFT_248268 [Rhizopus microsporus var. microsporus]